MFIRLEIQQKRKIDSHYLIPIIQFATWVGGSNFRDATTKKQDVNNKKKKSIEMKGCSELFN